MTELPVFDPTALPLRPAAYAATLGPTVVIAPHPDDESLGCGGLLALLARANVPVWCVLMSDGTMSHPNSAKFPAPARQALRETELRLALARLGLNPDRLLTLRLPDGQVPKPDAPTGQESVARLVDFLQENKPATVLCPWRRDPHPDHRATSQLVRAALTQLSQPPRLLEYLVWAWERAAPADLPRPGEVNGWQLDIEPVLAEKQQAITAHASQLPGSCIDDDPAGFTLAPSMLAHFASPTEVYLEAIGLDPAPPTSPLSRFLLIMKTNPNQPNTLPPDYFDKVYEANQDPWNFTSSTYEKEKYAATLAALPREHYARAFEIGCSLGILTAQLAPRCNYLLAVDVAEAALQQARQRCADLPQVELRQLRVPAEFPEGQFDLILVSEVGYYWSPADLARAADQIVAALPAGGQLVLVHWTPPVHDYPLTGDAVHEFFLEKASPDGPLRHLHGQRHDKYRLDVLERR